MSFGKARFGSNKSTYAKKNYFSVNENEQVFGLFPPMFDLEDKGVWTRFYKVHFGYKNSEGKLRTFLSTLKIDKDTKQVVIPDAASALIESYTGQRDEAKKAGNLQLAARFDKLIGMKGVYNMDKNWHINVHDLNGNVGNLKIRHRCMLKLEDLLGKLEAKGIDPFSPANGRYFTFRRVGTGPDTSFEVGVYAPEVEFHGRMIPDEKVRTISSELESKANRELTNLDKLFQSISPEEIKMIVDSADLITGKSVACDEIFDKRWKAEREAKKSVPAHSAASVETPSTVTTSPDEEEPSDEPQMTYTPPKTAHTAANAPIAQEAKAAVEAPKATATTASFEEMDDASFFAAVGLKQHG